MSLSLYGAGVGHVSVGPPLTLQGSGVTVELTVTDGWFVGVSTDSLALSCVDVVNRLF